MAKPKIVYRIALFALPILLLAVWAVPAFAFQDEPPIRKEQHLELNQDYEVIIGNGGVFIDDAQYIDSTLVVKAEQPLTKFGFHWHQFTQRTLDIRIYDKTGDQFKWVYGLVRVYFNLDKFQYDKWIDEEANMSIWYFDELGGGWRKCVTHWEAVPGLAKGRLWCVVRYYTRYGLAWTQPTLLMKAIKLGTITVTPTP
ncbi:MAG: hypothetical protein WD751_11095 [Anaerolineales bacterium]